MPLKKTVFRTVGLVAAAALVGFAAFDASQATTGTTARSKVIISAPAAPGGGWDLAARESQTAMRAGGSVNNVQVVNVPGAGGTIGLGQIIELAGDPTQLMMTGTVMMGAITVNNSPHSLLETTPIARLADDYEVFIVPTDSPFETLDDLLAAWAADPSGISIGGGSLGGTDHMLGGLVAKAADIDPGQMNYIPYAGGGEVLTALLSNTVDLGISGYNEFRDQIEAGNLRALAVSAEEPIEGIDTPTFIEQGIDVALPNWRGVVAPPGISDEERQELIDIVSEMVKTDEWASAIERNRWADTFLTGDDFTEFIKDEQVRIDAIIKDVGL